MPDATVTYRHRTEDDHMRTTPTLRRALSAAARSTPAALIALAAFAAAPAHAAARTPAAVCSHTFTATMTPGMTPTPAAGKLTTNGQTGTIECFGTIGGQRIIGPGTLGVVHRHTAGSCRGLVGTGRVRLVIPTAGGTKDLVGALAVRRTGLTVRAKARFPGLRYSGNGVVFPILGDCATTPLELVRVTMTGSLRETKS